MIPTEASTSRRVWFLNAGAFGERPLGPAVRLAAMARAAHEAGHEVRVVVESPRSSPLPQGVPLLDWKVFRLDQVRPGDAVVAGVYMGFPRLWRLLRSRISFHLDLYCLTAAEMLPAWSKMPPKVASRDLRKRRLRYQWALARAEKSWFSCPEQRLLAAGILLSDPSWKRARLAERVGALSGDCPMGVRSDPFPTGSVNPYPEALHGRPVFLWGGSLWSWMDPLLLVETFEFLRDRGSRAALFLLSGTDRSGRATESSPLHRLIEAAGARGLLGTSIVLNDRNVDPEHLAPWLEHCTAGIMANPDTLETRVSWRTRYLDLLWAAKPLVVAGADPLARRMEAAGCAQVVPAGRPELLADAVERLISDDSDSAVRRSQAALRLGRELSWSRTLAPLLGDLADSNRFREVGPHPGARDLLRYFAGF